MALAVRNCSVARRFKDFSTAMFFLLAGVVAQLKCALFRIIVYSCDVCACAIRHGQTCSLRRPDAINYSLCMHKHHFNFIR